MNRLFPATAVLALLAACSSAPPTPPPLAQAPQPPPPVVERTVVEQVPIPLTIVPREKETREKVSPAEAVRRAAKKGLVVPDPRDFVGMNYRPPYFENFWYEVYLAAGDGDKTSPDITLLKFQPGEIVRGIDAPDSVFWDVKPSYIGSEANPTFTIAVKPRRPYLHATMAVQTSRRLYMFRLSSFKNDRHVLVSFDYPGDEREETDERLAAIQRAVRRANGGMSADSAFLLPGCREAHAVSGPDVEWKPVPTPDGMPAACNDGSRTRINFPPNLGAIEGPVLFQADDADGTNARVVNARTIAGAWVVDGTPRVLLLRQGDNTVVIERRSHVASR